MCCQPHLARKRWEPMNERLRCKFAWRMVSGQCSYNHILWEQNWADRGAKIWYSPCKDFSWTQEDSGAKIAPHWGKGAGLLKPPPWIDESINPISSVEGASLGQGSSPEEKGPAARCRLATLPETWVKGCRHFSLVTRAWGCAPSTHSKHNYVRGSSFFHHCIAKPNILGAVVEGRWTLPDEAKESVVRAIIFKLGFEEWIELWKNRWKMAF